MKPRKAHPKSPRQSNAVRPQSTADKLFEPMVEALISDIKISKSKMFGSPGLKVGGKVFAMLVKEKLVVKLSQERVEALVASGNGARFDPGHGRIMKEWVTVKPLPKSEWLRLVEEARDFVASGL